MLLQNQVREVERSRSEVHSHARDHNESWREENVPVSKILRPRWPWQCFFFVAHVTHTKSKESKFSSGDGHPALPSASAPSEVIR